MSRWENSNSLPNRDDLSNVDPNLPVGMRPQQKATPDTWTAAKSIDDVHNAVFASMDIPPLFKNVVIDDELFEDGGVVDNLRSGSVLNSKTATCFSSFP